MPLNVAIKYLAADIKTPEIHELQAQETHESLLLPQENLISYFEESWRVGQRISVLEPSPDMYHYRKF